MQRHCTMESSVTYPLMTFPYTLQPWRTSRFLPRTRLYSASAATCAVCSARTSWCSDATLRALALSPPKTCTGWGEDQTDAMSCTCDGWYGLAACTAKCLPSNVCPPCMTGLPYAGSQMRRGSPPELRCRTDTSRWVQHRVQ